MSNPAPPPAGTVTMFSTTWCPFCRRLTSHLQGGGVEFTQVDIERRPDAADFVMSVNGGNRTVPTVLFPDGTTLTNPSLDQVRDRLG